jgi:hypothetical protein
MRRATKGATLVVCSALALTLVACGAIIGTRDDLTYDPDAAGAGGGDAGGSSADGTNVVGSDANSGGKDGSSPTDAATSDGSNLCPDVDASSDPKNCGACGHDCLGGACTSGKCQPLKLASNAFATYALAVDSTNLYFSDIDNGAIYTLPKNAATLTTATKIADTPDNLIYDIVSDPKGIGAYFSWGSGSSGEKGAVEVIGPDGGNRHALMQDASVARGLSMDSANVYFALTYLSPPEVGFVPRNATNGAPTILSANEPDTDNTHASGGYLYWGGEAKTNVRFCAVGTPPTSCTSSLNDFVTGVKASEALGGNTKNVFISGFDILYQAAKSTTTTTATGAAQNQPQVYSIAADDKEIYWLNLGTPTQFLDGSIRRCPVDANGAVKCTVTDGEIVATSDQEPRVIVMDDKAVYWTAQLEGSVYRLAR